MRPPSPTAADLGELAEKYRALAVLRAHRDGPQGQAGRATLQALAARHPGCLRELDTLGAPELERRASVTEAAAAGAATEPWMAWIWAYHRLMRATLATKRALGRGKLRAEAIPALAADATLIAGLPLDEAFVRAVAAPPQRRLGVAVLQLLGSLFGEPPARIAATLFPRRRPPPYTLGGDES
ncbi:MAG TPA: hypothetical protein VN914_02375 [Polyangia bacterium]|nr:hypothetical protein [Polyangia bacterium]